MLHGNPDMQPFSVKVSKDDTIDKLKDLIKEKRPCFTAVELKLWKWNESSEEVRDSDLDACKALDPRKTISDIFESDILTPGRTHIIIKTPEPGK